MSTTLPFQFASWTTTRLYGKTVWVPHLEAAVHFQKKAEATRDLASLRELEIIGVRNGASPEALDYLKDLMVEANNKVIALNRKAEREGWYTISDELMQKHIAGYKGL